MPMEISNYIVLSQPKSKLFNNEMKFGSVPQVLWLTDILLFVFSRNGEAVYMDIMIADDDELFAHISKIDAAIPPVRPYDLYTISILKVFFQCRWKAVQDAAFPLLKQLAQMRPTIGD